MASWFILRTRPNHEFRLETAIERYGILAYAPKLTIKRRHPFDKRIVLTVKKAIYPGYVFTPEHFPLESVTTTTLTAHWLKAHDGIAQIPQRLVDEAEAGEMLGQACEEVFEFLRCRPNTRRRAKGKPVKSFGAIKELVAA